MARVVPIALDFVRLSSRIGRLAPVLLVAGAASLAAAAVHYRSVAEALDSRAARVSELRELTRRALPALDDSAAATPEAREQLRKANEVLGQINVPWGELFSAIEAAQEKEVALLSVQPDARTRSVAISGQAGDMTDVLAYMIRLERGGRLREVVLTGHEIKVNDPGQATEFTLDARWVEPK